MPLNLTCQGVITIYLSLTLVLSGALIFTLTESARVRSLNAKLQSIAYSAADSVFSEFAEPVFDRYGVMMLWCSREEFIEEFGEYCRKNLANTGATGLFYSDLYRASYVSSALSSSISPADNGGRPFAEQVNEYMKYYLVEDAASRILDGISIFDQGSKVNAFMDRIEQYGEVFSRVEDSVSALKKKIDSVKAIARDPSDLLSQASENIDSFTGGDSAAAASFRKTMNSLKQAKKALSDGLEDVERASDSYYESAEDAREAVSELEDELNADLSDYDGDIYEVVSEQIEDIRQKSADTDFDFYLVRANLDTTDSYLNKLGSLDDLFDNVSDPLDKDNAQEYKDVISAYRQEFSDFDLSSLGVNLDTEETEKEDDSFLSRISGLMGNGLLGLIAGDVSEKTIDTSDFPSKTSSSASDNSDDSDLLKATEEKALFSEYILQHFGCCSPEKEVSAGSSKKAGPSSALEYETEYIISGKDSDRDNLAAVVADIVLIRSGCNLISILKSSAKKAETYALATSLAGCSGMPIVIKIFHILIMAAWALAESIADVKALIEGHRIRTIKDDSDWYLSLAGIKNFGSDAISSSGSERGLSYAGYLRLLLLMQNREKQCFRTMDMIQANMCLSENEEFRIAGCITSLTVHAEFSAPQLFINMPFVSSVVSASGGSYKYSLTQKYQY